MFSKQKNEWNSQVKQNFEKQKLRVIDIFTKSQAFCLWGLKSVSSFDFTTLKYPMYELL